MAPTIEPAAGKGEAMANDEQLKILKRGARAWNKWRNKNPNADVELSRADISKANLSGADLSKAYISEANFEEADLSRANLMKAVLSGTNLYRANLTNTDLNGAKLIGCDLRGTMLNGADLVHSNFWKAWLGATIFGYSDLSEVTGLADVNHHAPSIISIDTFDFSKGKIPEVFLRGCGLSDADIEYSKLSNPSLSNEAINKILYRIYDIRASQAIQISPLFISYGHADSPFVDKLESHLNKRGIRFWRDIHEMKAGRMEKQIDHAIRQNPTVLLVLSQHSLSSDWVEHEVRKARELEKEMGRDVLCPVALDDSWKSSPWPKRVMEQVMEYNILDFSAWKDDSKFGDMFRKLIDGLELFYKG